MIFFLTAFLVKASQSMISCNIPVNMPTSARRRAEARPDVGPTSVQPRPDIGWTSDMPACSDVQPKSSRRRADVGPRSFAEVDEIVCRWTDGADVGMFIGTTRQKYQPAAGFEPPSRRRRHVYWDNTPKASAGDRIRTPCHSNARLVR